MTKVFVDTAAWIALLNVRDNLHHQANEVMDRILRLETTFGDNRVCTIASVRG
ncbi:MAG: hypothetical protein ACYTXC_20095 [Nostoc sp.]